MYGSIGRQISLQLELTCGCRSFSMSTETKSVQEQCLLLSAEPSLQLHYIELSFIFVSLFV